MSSKNDPRYQQLTPQTQGWLDYVDQQRADILADRERWLREWYASGASTTETTGGFDAWLKRITAKWSR